MPKVFEKLVEKDMLGDLIAHCPLCGNELSKGSAELSKSGDVVAGPCFECKEEYYTSCTNCSASVHQELTLSHPLYTDENNMQDCLCVDCYNIIIDRLNEENLNKEQKSE